MKRVLIIDDEDVFREDLATLLRLEGYDCRTAPDGPRGLEEAAALRPAVVLCDLSMPGMHGLEVVEKLVSANPECAVLVVTAHATLDSAVQAFRLGATDLVLKPVVPEALLRTLRWLSETQDLRNEVSNLRRTLTRQAGTFSLVGVSEATQQIRMLIERVAPHDSPVLITGESGTGKELVAGAIHRAGPNGNGPFAAFNCSAVPGNLFESEIFGHVKGAFTGAEHDRAGYFEAASGGTLLLDEVGEVSMGHQAKLLRAIETKEIVPVGQSTAKRVSTRVLASTNRNLQAMVQDGAFRSDLYYRLRVVHIEISPLRDRRDDIPPLVEHFVAHFNRAMTLRCDGVDATALRALRDHDWPGNIRELKNAIERALIIGSGERIRLEDLPPDVAEHGGDESPPTDHDDLREALKNFEQAHIRRILRRTGGNRAEAARRLGIDASTLWRKLSER